MEKVDPVNYDTFIKISEENDIVLARKMAKDFANKAGFSLADVTKIATTVSELARNIYRYAKEGLILFKLRGDEKDTIEIVAFDEGPGIEDLELALTKGYSTTKRSLGLGLSGIKRLMDEFKIESKPGKGTIVKVAKRKRRF